MQVDILLSVLAPLAEDQSDGPTANEWDDPEEFVEEQGLMGRLIHMLRSPNPGQLKYWRLEPRVDIPPSSRYFQ